MKLQELKKELQKKLTEIKDKISEVEMIMKKQETPSKSLKDKISELKNVQEDILLQYDQLEAMEEEETPDYSDLEKNIYKNLEAFDAAFSKAGSIMKESKFKTRDRSVDYKNPPATK